jgi:hypothetical protein
MIYFVLAPDNSSDNGRQPQLPESESLDICPKCFNEMSLGAALIGAPRGITYEGHWPIRLTDCLKCHSCGHSEVLQAANTHYEVPHQNIRVGYGIHWSHPSYWGWRAQIKSHYGWWHADTEEEAIQACLSYVRKFR